MTASSRRERASWTWLKAELLLRLGREAAEELWREYARLARVDQLYAELASARRALGMIESQIAMYGSSDRLRSRLEAVQARVSRAERKVAKIEAAAAAIAHENKAAPTA